MWKYPNKVYKWPLFVFGWVFFWILAPFWFYMIKYVWKEDSLFAIVHLQAIFYNWYDIVVDEWSEIKSAVKYLITRKN